MGMLINNIWDITLLIVIMFVVKLVPSLLMLFRGLTFKEILASCSLLAAPLTLVIAIMELGLHNPEKTGITPEMSAKMIAAGIFASLIYPSIARRLLKDTPIPQSLAEH